MVEWLPSMIIGGSTIIAALIAGCIANRYQRKQHTLRTVKPLLTETCELLRRITNLTSPINQWIIQRSNKININSKELLLEKIMLSLSDFKIDLDILRNKVSIQLKISTQNSEKINKVYYAYKETNEIITKDFSGNPVDDFEQKIQNKMDDIVSGIYEIMNIIYRSKIRFGWKRIKKPLVQENHAYEEIEKNDILNVEPGERFKSHKSK